MPPFRGAAAGRRVRCLHPRCPAQLGFHPCLPTAFRPWAGPEHRGHAAGSRVWDGPPWARRADHGGGEARPGRGYWRRTWPFGGQTLPGSGTLPVWSVQLFPLLLARPFPCTRPSQADQPDPAHPNCPEANVKPAAGPNDRKDAPLAL